MGLSFHGVKSSQIWCFLGYLVTIMVFNCAFAIYNTNHVFISQVIRPISRKLRPNYRKNIMLFIENGSEFQMHFLWPISIKLRPNYRKIWCFYKKWARNLAALSQILWNKKNSITDKVCFFFFIQNGSDLLTHFLRPISIKTQTQLLKKDGVFFIQNGSEFPKYFLRFISIKIQTQYLKKYGVFHSMWIWILVSLFQTHFTKNSDPKWVWILVTWGCWVWNQVPQILKKSFWGDRLLCLVVKKQADKVAGCSV